MNKIFGMIILAVGVLYLLNNTGVIDASFGEMVSTYWTLIIVIIGLKILLDGLFRAYQGLKRDKWDFGTAVFGLFIIAAGLIITGNRADWFYYTFADLWSWIWPLLIIFVGFQLLRNKRPTTVKVDMSKDEDDREPDTAEKKADYADPWSYVEENISRAREQVKNNPHVDEEKYENSFQSAEDSINKARQQAGGKYKYRQKKNHRPQGGDYANIRQFVGEVVIGKRPWTLENTDIRTSIGSVEVDLTTAVLKDGDNYLDISMWIGSVEITAPKDMAIQANVDVSIGEATLFDDNFAGTGRNATYTSDNFYEAEQRVILTVRNSIGSVEVMAVD
ncbi:cell wall-active antibiotics response protein LiaF [Alteribacter keqinensis]|nr:cell wall-active antibiotics response protein LiaF [Alteribacter keqinensis]